MGQQDLGYKRVFAHREMVEDLLRGFVREPWVAEVEMDTLERVGGTYVSDDLRERADDIIWRVRWRDRWLYVYLLLEFQSTVDPFMALRILVYVGLLYQDLVREKKLTPDGRLPPVLPLVLYSGEEGWTAATEISELIESVPGGLERYRPQMRYLLVEERGFSDAELASMRNLVAALFRLENSCGPEDIIQVLELLIEWLRAPEQADLARAFGRLAPPVFAGQPDARHRYPRDRELTGSKNHVGRTRQRLKKTVAGRIQKRGGEGRSEKGPEKG